MSEVEGQLESYTNVDLGGGQSTEATGQHCSTGTHKGMCRTKLVLPTKEERACLKLNSFLSKKTLSVKIDRKRKFV